MSLRQLRKLKNANNRNQTEEPLSDSADESPQPVRRANLFAALHNDDSHSSSSDSEIEEREIAVSAETAAAPKSQPSRKKKPGKQKQRAIQEAAGEDEDEEDIDQLLAELNLNPPTSPGDSGEASTSGGAARREDVPEIFRLDKNCMNPEQEAKRLFGGAKAGGAAAGSRTTGRRREGGIRKFVFVTPDEEWPTKLRGNLRTEKTGDGEFELRSSEEYEKELGKLFEISEVQSFELLIDFIRKYPFNVHALLSVVEVFRQVRQFEQAMDILRRAVFALECEMHYEFEPSRAPKLSENSIFNFALLKALLLYVHLLVGQGCLETALEISKFLVVVDRRLDRTHSLLRLDLLAVRARKHDMLEAWNRKFLANSKFLLSDVLPNFAYSLALSRYFRLPDLSSGLDTDAPVEALISDDPEVFGRSVSGVLIRALLKFPVVLKALVAKWQDKTRLDWLRLFSQAPFSDGSELPVLGRVSEAYAEHAASFWRPDVLQGWMFACAEKAVSLAKDVRVSEFRKRHASSLRSRESLAVLDRYKDVLAAEFNSSIADFVLPKSIIDNDDYVMSIYRPNYSRNPRRAGDEGPANVSLDSNPVLVFLQTLLPWARVDTSGTQAQPVTVGGLVDRLRDAFGALAAPVIPADPTAPAEADVRRAEGEADDDEEDEDGEIDMDEQ